MYYGRCANNINSLKAKSLYVHETVMSGAQGRFCENWEQFK